MVLLTALLQGAMMVPRTRRLNTLELEYNYQILEAIIDKNNISVPPFSGSKFGLKGGQIFLFFRNRLQLGVRERMAASPRDTVQLCGVFHVVFRICLRSFSISSLINNTTNLPNIKQQPPCPFNCRFLDDLAPQRPL